MTNRKNTKKNSKKTNFLSKTFRPIFVFRLIGGATLAIIVLLIAFWLNYCVKINKIESESNQLNPIKEEVLGVHKLIPAPKYIRSSRTRRSFSIYWENTFNNYYGVEIWNSDNTRFITGKWPDSNQACNDKTFVCSEEIYGLKSNTSYVARVRGVNYSSEGNTYTLLIPFVTLKWYQFGSRQGTE